ncbi:MAG: presqualene diphosphate synthase HpnD [Calditrichia bacterium]
MNAIKSISHKIAQKSKSSFYYSFQVLPPEKREAIYTVYSFCRITDDIVDSRDPANLKKDMLDDWQIELEKALTQKSSKNPVINELLRVINVFSIPIHLFFELIDGARMDLQGGRFPSFNDLYEYCYKVATVVGFMSVYIFGFRSPKTLKYAENLGIALQLTNIMRDVEKDAEEGRIYLPLNDMKKYNVHPEDIFQKKYSENFKQLMQYEYYRARKFYTLAVKNLSNVDKLNLIASEIMRKTYWIILQRIKKAQFNIYNQNFNLSDPYKKLIAVSTTFENVIGL